MQVLQTKDTKAITAALDAYVDLYGIYDLIIFVDPQGRWIASNSLSPDKVKVDTEKLKNMPFAQAPWFQKGDAFGVDRRVFKKFRRYFC
jgi:hypothetical protein